MDDLNKISTFEGLKALTGDELKKMLENKDFKPENYFADEAIRIIKGWRRDPSLIPVELQPLVIARLIRMVADIPDESRIQIISGDNKVLTFDSKLPKARYY